MRRNFGIKNQTRMKRTFIFICTLLILYSSAGAQNVPDQSVVIAENRRFEAMTQRDTLELAKILSDELVYIHSNGLLESKPTHLKAIATGAIVYRSLERAEEPVVRRYKTIAIINGVVKVTGIINTSPFELRLRYTAVYKRQRHRWQLLNWQSTRLN